MVARPGIIDLAFAETDLVNVNRQTLRIACLFQSAGCLDNRCCHYHKTLVSLHGRCNTSITFLNLIKFIPWSGLVRPCKLDTALMFPFCR